MGVHQFLEVLRQRWRSLVATVLLGLVATGVLIYLTPSTYQSSTTLFVSTPPTEGLVNTYAAVMATQERVQSYSQLASDRAVLEASAERIGGGVTAADLGDRVTSRIVEGTLLVVIEAEAGSPEDAREVASVVSDEVIAMINELEEAGGKSVRLPFVASIAATPSRAEQLVEPDLPIAAGTGLVLSLLVGLCVAVMRERLDTTVSTPEQIAAATGQPAVTVVPRDRDARDALTEQGVAAEAFRVLRTNLEFADLDVSRPLVLVTSPTPREGRTFVATGLASAAARAGRSVLLIDADLRRPGVADRLGVDGSVGLVSVLVGDTSLEDALVDHPDGMTVLPSGPLPPNPATLLESSAMGDLLAAVRGRYDLVVIDAPAVLPTADASILVAHADGVLLVARHNATRREELRLSAERVDAVDGRLYGVVLNAAPRGVASYEYGYEPVAH